MVAVQKYFLTLILTGVFCSVLQSLVPATAFRQAVSVACGLLLILALVRPILRINLSDVARTISKLEIADFEVQTGLEIDNQSLMAAIIKEQAETYIWDKAEELAFAPIDIEIQMKEDGGYPIPDAAKICGAFTDTQRMQLSRWMEQNLAIPVEDQEWIWNKR